MEVPNGKRNMGLVLIYEFLGTMFLVYAINISQGNSIAIALMLFCWLLIGGPISGAHYNPAVTIGVYIN